MEFSEAVGRELYTKHQLKFVIIIFKLLFETNKFVFLTYLDVMLVTRLTGNFSHSESVW